MADGLQWREWRDFSGGLWERGTERDVPDDGLVDLIDGQPLLPGGIRAAFRWTTHVNTSQDGSSAGIPTSTSYNLMGFDVLHTGLSTTPHRIFCLTAPATLPGGTTETRLFGSSSTASTAAYSFSEVKAFSATTAYVPTRFVLHSHSTGGAGVTRQYMHVAEAHTTSIGVWMIAAAGNTLTSIAGGQHYYHLESHQARLVAVTRSGSSPLLFRQRLDFSDDDSDANITASSNNVDPSDRPGDIGFMYSRMPSDLAVMKTQLGVFQINGALAQNPIVYEMTRVHPSQQISFAAETPAGLAYMTEDEGVWAYTGGQQPVYLSPQFVGTPMTEIVMANSLGNGPGFLGQPAYAGTYLFTPKGYVLDFHSRAWFKASALNTSPPFAWLQYERVSGRIFAARHTASGGIQVLSASINEATMDRSTSLEFELPLWAQPGRTLSLQEIEMSVQAHQSGSRVNWSVTAPLPSGAEVTYPQPPVVLEGSGFQTFRMRPLMENGTDREWLRLRFTLSASTAEAPTVSRVLAGYQMGPPHPVR